jgi:hypothetical protein
MSHPTAHKTDEEATVNKQGIGNRGKRKDQKIDGRGRISPVLVSKQSQ